MKHFSVIEVTPTNEAWIADYVNPVNKLVAQYGGKYLARTSSHQRMEGDREKPALQIIIEWPSKEAATGFFNDPAYRPYFEARTAGSRSYHSLIEAKDDLA